MGFADEEMDKQEIERQKKEAEEAWSGIRSRKEEDSKTGEDDMAVAEKELKNVQQLQQRRKLTKEEIRKAMIKQTIQENYEALHRLSRT